MFYKAYLFVNRHSMEEEDRKIKKVRLKTRHRKYPVYKNKRIFSSLCWLYFGIVLTPTTAAH